ncbi:MAG: CinA family nicotinamide mononucleotide deamidase-related protein [Thermoleophilia bacterium]|nr:CinA family nicotinamide mononucleotide deamidase-related protein [Thermoleophilia bacterium]
MRAAIITIGTELTDGRIVDTNTAFVARKLEERGLRVALAMTVPDDDAAISKGLNYALGRDVALVVIAGGLGPTQDDITAPAVTRALELELEMNLEAAAMVADAVHLDAGSLAKHQVKQAILPGGARPITPAGTAPGFALSHHGAHIIVLPGVPWELRAMWEEAMAAPELLKVNNDAIAPARRRLCFYGAGEPEVSAAVESILGKDLAGIEVSICARYREVILEVAFSGESERRVEDLLEALQDRFADFVYSEGQEIEGVIATELGRIGKSLSVAESCTGGMLGETITGVSGASKFFRGGVIAYDNEIKKTVLKVSQESLDSEGAVSESVARQLALGVKDLCGADYGIGITGIAGPGGGTQEKPVGLVFICVASGETSLVRRFNFFGGRDDVRRAAVTAALHLLHRQMLADSHFRE